MSNNNIPLLSRDFARRITALNASLVYSEENMDDDSFDDDVEMDNIGKLSIYSSKSCVLKYFAEYIVKKNDKSQCHRRCLFYSEQATIRLNSSSKF